MTMKAREDVGNTGTGAGHARERTAARFLTPERAALLALAVYGALLWFLRPVAPFEWYEVLAQSAILHYDVASHSPQPPGSPA